MDVDKEVRELKRRLDLAETRLSQLEGRFEFISGQLRDIQLYMHARFNDIDGRLDGMDRRFDQLENKVDGLTTELRAMPRGIAEMIAERR